MEIKKWAQENFDYMVRHRRYLHEHPELSRMENETVAYIIQELEALGIEYIDVKDGGVLGFIHGALPGKTVLLRADIDALPVDEPENNLKCKRLCRSQNPGVMHACGHDAHTAMLLGAGKILNEHRDQIKGTVMLVFERGEEGGGNIRQILQYFEDHQVRYDSCFAMHVEQKLPTGTFGISAGYCDAGSIPLNFQITGRGGHSSRPDLANNPVNCMVAFLNEIYAIRDKYISPFEQLTTSICVIQGGTKGNIIPDTIRFEGSARYFSEDKAKAPFLKQLERVKKACEEAYGCKIEALKSGGARPIINEEYTSAIAKQAVINVLGEEAWRPTMPTMGSESFSLYAAFAPGCYGNLGICTPEKGSGAEIHNQYFDIDEDAMIVGASVHVSYALEFLNSDGNIPFTPQAKSVAELYA